MTEKLYEVHVEFTFYALAESPTEACGNVRDAFSDEDHYAITDAQEVTANTLPDWTGDSLVYGGPEDVTLDEALAKQGLPSVVELKKAWAEKTAEKIRKISK